MVFQADAEIEQDLAGQKDLFQQISFDILEKTGNTHGIQRVLTGYEQIKKTFAEDNQMLDMPTVIIMSTLIYLAGAISMLRLWLVSRKHFPATGYWLLCYSFFSIGSLLILLRPLLPGIVSIVLANNLILAAAISLVFGLQNYLNRKLWIIPNLVIFLLFTCIQTVFGILQPDLIIRSWNVVIALLLLNIEAIIVMTPIHAATRRNGEGITQVILVSFAIANLARLVNLRINPPGTDNFLKLLGHDQIFLIVYAFLMLLLGFSLISMLNNRLLSELSFQQQKFAKAFKSSAYAVVLVENASRRIVEVNNGFERLSGYTATEALGKTADELQLWPDAGRTEEVRSILRHCGRTEEHELPFRKKDGQQRIMLSSAEHIEIEGQMFSVGNFVDVTERVSSEKLLRSLLAEKELILREVHHRIKNNMSTISALLRIQSDQQQAPAAAEALITATRRIDAMMLLYDKLYHSDNVNSLQADLYFPPLMEEIAAIFSEQKNIRLCCSVEALILDPRTLSTLGLILNELTSNSLKHAFQGRTSGSLQLDFYKANDSYHFIFSDDGCGFPEEEALSKQVYADGSAEGFGLQLLKLLVGQLFGTYTIENQQKTSGTGTRVHLQFRSRE